MLLGGGEETLQRRMDGIFTGEGDLSVLLIGNSLFLAIGQCLLPRATHSSFMPARQGILQIHLALF